MERLWGILKILDDAEHFERALEKMVSAHQPDAILFVSSVSCNILRLKSYYRGSVFFYDFDGPRRRTADDYLQMFDRKLDGMFTVSRWTYRHLFEKGKNAVYLPHGVDTDYYTPCPPQENFASAVSYIGRATDRRIDLCSRIDKRSLALYGERWRRSERCKSMGLLQCVRLDRNVRDRELVSIYCSSQAVLNILQEPLNEFQTILSIQCFAVPASGGCLIAEYVEELPEAFEAGKEVLCFHSPDELKYLSEKCIREPEFSCQVGKAGRRRCLAEHQWVHRVDIIKKYF